jgi:hypothetical protein
MDGRGRLGDHAGPWQTRLASFLRSPRCGVSWPDLHHAMRLQTHAEPNRRLKIFPELRDTSKGQREGVDFAESGASPREKRVLPRQRSRYEEAPHRETGGSVIPGWRLVVTESILCFHRPPPNGNCGLTPQASARPGTLQSHRHSRGQWGV